MDTNILTLGITQPQDTSSACSPSTGVEVKSFPLREHPIKRNGYAPSDEALAVYSQLLQSPRLETSAHDRHPANEHALAAPPPSPLRSTSTWVRCDRATYQLYRPRGIRSGRVHVIALHTSSRLITPEKKSPPTHSTRLWRP